MTPEESKMLKGLHDAVCGDDEYNNPGLIANQNELKRKVHALATWRTWMTGVFVGVMGALSTYLKVKH